MTPITAFDWFPPMIAAIRDYPDDDTPRLVLADWLEENADWTDGPDGVRAEFIRVQCELAKMGCTKVQPELGEQSTWLHGCCQRRGTLVGIDCDSFPCHVIRRRERELWAANAYDWLKNWTGAEQLAVEKNAAAVAFSTMPTASTKYEFHRGFLSRVRCSWADAAQHLDTILADPWVPGLDEVELTTWPDWRAWDNLGTVVERLGALARRVISAMLTDVWPKEKVRSWTLPPEPQMAWSRNAGTPMENIRRVAQQMRENTTRGGLPPPDVL